MKTLQTGISFALLLLCNTALFASSVGITSSISSVEVIHQGKPVIIERNQNNKNTINSDYTLTSRACPPFCIKPIKLAEGVETIGELEMIDYLVAASKPGSNILVIDSRTPDWVAKGTIPGSVNLPWTLLKEDTSDPITIATILEDRFGAIDEDELWDFSKVKTLVLYCNGMWCGQSPRNIMTLLKYGYPAEKIKWYRGGMQNWHALGLTTIKSEK
ncbi:MAG: rhodanese-like domain-containing protein [Xanthomonadales bacterium]|nr:rhodanese-like domain-containing protein [Xanthomonadales bacterium]